MYLEDAIWHYSGQTICKFIHAIPLKVYSAKVKNLLNLNILQTLIFNKRKISYFYLKYWVDMVY